MDLLSLLSSLIKEGTSSREASQVAPVTRAPLLPRRPPCLTPLLFNSYSTHCYKVYVLIDLSLCPPQNEIPREQGFGLFGLLHVPSSHNCARHMGPQQLFDGKSGWALPSP